MTDPAPYLEILDQALTEPHGVAVLCYGRQEAETARAQLYVVRREARDEGQLKYDDLSISFSPTSPEILFIYRTALRKKNGTP